MKKTEAMALSICVLGALDTYLTATVLPIPVWVTFIAWASFFILGGGARGFKQSIACNLTGVFIGWSSLFASGLVPGNVPFLALCVGVGSACMVLSSKVTLLQPTPAVVWGFASLVATTVATGVPVTHAGLTNPGLIAAAAVIVGASFGFAHELMGSALSRE